MRSIARGIVAALVLCGPALAVNDPDELMPGRIGLVKPGILTKFVSKPTTPFNLPTNAVASGSLTVFDSLGSGGPGAVSGSMLTAGTWKGLGNPAGSKGWKYLGAGSGSDPCKVVLIKTTVVKAVCKGPGITLVTPFVGGLAVMLHVGPIGGSKNYCALIGGTTVKDTATIFKAINAPAPFFGCPGIPVPTTTTTSSSSTSSSSSTTSSSTSSSTTSLPSCCGPERIGLVSSAGTLRVDNLTPFPFPPGVLQSLDTAATDDGLPSCHHSVLIPGGGFSVPHFDIPALNYCSEVITLGCESGGADGKGNLWDGNGSTAANTNVSKQADTNDGVCDNSFTGANCTTLPGGAGANTLGKIVTMHSASGTSGIRDAVDMRVKSISWSDSVCSPATSPGCCVTSSYGDDTVANGELKITEFDFILSDTTDAASGAFVDLNSDGCVRAGSGFNTPAPDGPKILNGAPAAGPCCTVGQSTTVVAVGIGFSGGAPLFDLGFQATTPNTVASCGTPASGSCVLTTDPCLGSASGAFLDPLQ